jgi:hypothetical protein
VPEAVTAAREAIDALRGHRTLRRHASEVASESALRGARASAALAGSDVPLDALRRGDDNADPVVRGALRVAGELGTLRTTWRRAPLQVLARLHALAAAGQVSDDELGRPAPTGAHRLVSLGELLVVPTEAPTLVVAAVAHAEVASSEAFPVAGDVVARAVGRLTMIDRGLDPGALGVPEVGHLELGPDAYAAALSGYRAGGPEGLAGWVVHCAEAVVLGAREAVAICESLQRAR